VVAVDEEDAPVGYGEIYHEPSRFDPRRYFIRLAVDSRLRRHGIGASLWTTLRAELDERSAKVACLWTDDGTACRQFIVERGFVEVVRSFEQVLALATAPSPIAAAQAAVSASGIRVESLSELLAREGDGALRPIHELYTTSRLDQPTLGAVTARPFEDWRREIFDELHAVPDGFFVARDGERLIGCSAVRTSGDDVLRILITGVLPEYRRQGIAHLLKLRVHAWGRVNGYREIHTSTANPAVVALNTALGYAIVASWGGYELAIR
jgi:GNAT superfamily N-acetyltransferase